MIPLLAVNTPESSIIALCALAISVITTVIMLVGQRHNADNDYVLQLEKRVERLERELEIAEGEIREAKRENDRMMRENMLLLRELAKIPDDQL